MGKKHKPVSIVRGNTALLLSRLSLSIGLLIICIFAAVNFRGFEVGTSQLQTISPFLAAAVAIGGLFANERWKRRSTETDRQRKFLDKWFETLIAWVTEKPLDKYEIAYLSDPYIVQLNLRKEDRHVALWINQQVAEINRLIEGLKVHYAAHTELLGRGPGQVSRALSSLETQIRRDQTAVIESVERLRADLLRWHQGDLKTIDFYVPSALLKAAALEGEVYEKFLRECRMQGFGYPVRLSLSTMSELGRAICLSPRAARFIDVCVLSPASWASIVSLILGSFAVKLRRLANSALNRSLDQIETPR